MDRLPTIARTLATLLVWVAVGLSARATWQAGTHTPALRAADALPVYLAGAAVADGEDPTTQAGLKAAYDRREMRVRAATFSNLYPASAGVLVQPIARGTWEDFILRWRALLLAGALLAGAGAGFASTRGPWRPLATALGAGFAVGLFPVTGECLALGQANMLVAGLLGLAMAALAVERGGLAGAAAVLGAGLKLVPGIAVWPLLAARRWRALAWSALMGAALTALTVHHVPLDRVIDGVLATLHFQAGISPDWMNRGPTPDWMRFVGFLRHTPMTLWTVLLMGAAAWRTGPRGVGVLPGTIALATAWLGADAAAYHILYAPLMIPALVYVALWPLDNGAPRWAWLLLPVAALPSAAVVWSLTDVPVEARLVLVGVVTWLAVSVRLVWASRGLPWIAWLTLGVSVGWGLARADRFDEGPRGPAPTQVDSVTAYGLPEGVGHGGPSPGDGPTELDGQPQAEQVRLEAVLDPKQTQRLTSHLIQVPQKWAQVDDPLAQWLAEAAPQPPAALVGYREMVLWMTWEGYAVAHLQGARSAKDEYRRMWRVLTAEPR